MPETPSIWSGARIRAFREARGWTQRDLAERLGTRQSYISRLEIEYDNGTMARAGFRLRYLLDQLEAEGRDDA